MSPINETKASLCSSSSNSDNNGGAQPRTVDLIVLNLASSTTEEGLRDYFESKFGSLLMVELKRDRKTGNSRRFAFIRFRNYKDQMKALNQMKFKLDNQQIRLALPDFRDPSELYQENKCFVGRVNEQIKANDLRDFFSQFGDIVEVSYPKKFKGYAFITFADPDVARKVCGQDFIVKGYSLCVSKSTHGNNKNKDQQQPYSQNNMNNSNNYQDFTQDWSNGWFPSNNNNRDQWMPPQKYVTAPLNPQPPRPNYANANQLNPMLLNMAIQHANQILTGGGGGYNVRNLRNFRFEIFKFSFFRTILVIIMDLPYGININNNRIEIIIRITTIRKVNKRRSNKMPLLPLRNQTRIYQKDWRILISMRVKKVMEKMRKVNV